MPQRPIVGILVSRDPDLTPRLGAFRSVLARDGVPVVAVIVSDRAGHAIPAAEETERVAGPSLDSRLARDLVAALVRTAADDRRLALARQLPALREAVTAVLIEDTAQANASYALASGVAEVVPILTAPMNLGDMVVLTKNQLVMSYRIALGCGLDGNPKRLIPEILGVLGGGLLFRQLARQLVGFIPVIGIVPKVIVAYAGTYAIGRAVTIWALEGRAASSDAVQRFSREGLERGRDLARTLAAGARRSRRTAEDAGDTGRPSHDATSRPEPSSRERRG
jgi:uncharacterized protein (DUF697 family)